MATKENTSGGWPWGIIGLLVLLGLRWVGGDTEMPRSKPASSQQDASPVSSVLEFFKGEDPQVRVVRQLLADKPIECFGRQFILRPETMKDISILDFTTEQLLEPNDVVRLVAEVHYRDPQTNEKLRFHIQMTLLWGVSEYTLDRWRCLGLWQEHD